MDSFEFNKIIGGLLATVFVMFSVTIVADSLFAAHSPEKPGYIIEAAEPAEGGGEEAGAEEEPIAVLLASADVDAGQTAFRKCQACHTVEEGGANKVGPNLYNIVNRPVASHEGFSYSAGMRTFAEGGKVWDYDHLSGFLVAPRNYVPGTAMAFGGIKNRQEEANLIAYLRTLSPNPAPLPEAPAETDAAAAPAEGGAQPAKP
jgi:cytochrome c